MTTVQIPHTKYFELCVREFHTSFECPFYKHLDEAPCELHKLRADLILEEQAEYYAAREDKVEELDALCDLAYVVAGTAITYNIPIVPYTSGQLVVPNCPKQKMSVSGVTNDLLSMFPCMNILRPELNILLRHIDDVAKMRGYDMHGAFSAVHANNMAKLWPEPPEGLAATKKDGGWLVRRVDGKVLKPPGHTKVDLSRFTNFIYVGAQSR